METVIMGFGIRVEGWNGKENGNAYNNGFIGTKDPFLHSKLTKGKALSEVDSLRHFGA